MKKCRDHRIKQNKNQSNKKWCEKKRLKQPFTVELLVGKSKPVICKATQD